MIRIAHLTSVHPQNDNRILYKECTTLAHAGYDVTLIVAGGENQIVNKVRIVGYPKPAYGRLKRILKTSLIDMIQVCQEVNTDIYHFHDPELIFVGLYLKWLGKTVIYDVHENNPAAILSKPYIQSAVQKKVLSKLFDWFEKSTAGFFDAIVTARPDISRRFMPHKPVTLRNFPILPNLSSLRNIALTKEKPSVIYVGGMTEIRGIGPLLDAFAQLDQYELWLLGPIKEEHLRTRIYQGVPNVRYLGEVEAYEVFGYIDLADAGIITFLPLPNHLQTLATKPFEYMACGKPMIMSNFEYWKETFGESSLYVDPDDPADIRHKVRLLMEDAPLRERMSRRNKKLSEEVYNWEQESCQLLALYQMLSKESND